MNNNSMTEYRFTSDSEPEYEDLQQLMHEVAVEAKRKSQLAMEKLQIIIKEQVSDAMKREGFIQK
jgi:hypothetical protein